MNALQSMLGLPLILIVLAAALATTGLAFVLPDLVGRKPKTKSHNNKTAQHIRPAIGSDALFAQASNYLECKFDAVPGSIGIIVRNSHGRDDTGVFVHWLTKPGDLVHQDLPALEAARIHGVRRDLGELTLFEPAPLTGPSTKH
ncbi:hypothetical protein [Streptomyces sp. NPDC088141]|uniref:hypothetical protein n=1 Tax=unclassified Streptomyces TaxID=2593676 RepID=UPI003431D3ED